MKEDNTEMYCQQDATGDEGGDTFTFQELQRGHQINGIDTVWQETHLQDQRRVHLVRVPRVLPQVRGTAHDQFSTACRERSGESEARSLYGIILESVVSEVLEAVTGLRERTARP